jgi:hypothetical protein
MDYHLEVTVAKALEKQPKTAEFLLKNLSMDRVVALLKSLLLDLLPEEEEAIQNLIAEIADLRSDRNEILHWSWRPGETEETAMSTSLRPFREFRYASKKASEIQEVADQMQNAAHALMQWQQLLHKRVHGS